MRTEEHTPKVCNGPPAEFWLKRQRPLRVRLAKQQAGKTIRALPTLKRRKGRDQRQPAHS
jgi:hypothetical protein